MKIVISASGATLSSPVDPRFGRSLYYLFVDTETDPLQVQAQQNTSAASGSGAGIQAAQYIVQEGARAVITGNVGPNAYQVLEAANIAIYHGQGMTAQDAVDAYKSGELGALQGASQAGHASPNPSAPPSPPDAGQSDEVQMLKQEVAELRQSVATLLRKVDSLTKK
ncbi:MAG: NifB/NifX family molybdenum-iron cluster-binding protein [Anaerolineales bacterium]